MIFMVKCKQEIVEIPLQIYFRIMSGQSRVQCLWFCMKIKLHFCANWFIKWNYGKKGGCCLPDRQGFKKYIHSCMVRSFAAKCTLKMEETSEEKTL